MKAPKLHAWQRAGMSPIQRTLAWLHAKGYAVAVVERWIPGANRRKDCFGCDLLAASPAHGIVLVQVCGTDMAQHITKLARNMEARTFVAAGGHVECIGWRKLKAAGGWAPRIWCLNTGIELPLHQVLVGVPWQPRLIRA